MAESHFFNKNDLIRVMLLASALFFFIGTFQAVFIHSSYSGQISSLKKDLRSISALMSNKAEEEYSEEAKRSINYKKVSERADDYAKRIEGPEVTPHAYSFFNYWLSSAAFTELQLSPSDKGLPNETVNIIRNLENEEVLGEKGWIGREEFRGYSMEEGEYTIFLEKIPSINSFFWTFYIYAFLIGVASVFFGTKEEYTFSLVPEMLYGWLCYLPFWLAFTFSAVLSKTELVPLLNPNNVDLFVYVVVLVIMGGIGLFSGFVGGLLRMKFSGEEE